MLWAVLSVVVLENNKNGGVLMQENKGNREYKSDVFSMLMQDKENALALYNAINNSNYDDPELVQMENLDRGISLTVRNDAAFVLDANLSVYEHQSTVCPNMPLRSLVYFSTIIEPILKGKNIFSRKLVKIPTPKFAVFYNGLEEQPERYELKLSDAYINQTDNPQLQLKCMVYNINAGRNRELLDKCKFLKEYMTFVDYVREFNKEMNYENLRAAIERAIDRCINENVLREFLIERRSEVVKMTQLDYSFERQLMLECEEARTEGWNKGRSEGRNYKLLELVCKKLKKHKSVDEIAEELEENISEIQPLYNVAIKFSPDFDVIKIYKAMSEGVDK